MENNDLINIKREIEGLFYMNKNLDLNNNKRKKSLSKSKEKKTVGSKANIFIINPNLADQSCRDKNNLKYNFHNFLNLNNLMKKPECNWIESKISNLPSNDSKLNFFNKSDKNNSFLFKNSFTNENKKFINQRENFGNSCVNSIPSQYNNVNHKNFGSKERTINENSNNQVKNDYKIFSNILIITNNSVKNDNNQVKPPKNLYINQNKNKVLDSSNTQNKSIEEEKEKNSNKTVKDQSGIRYRDVKSSEKNKYVNRSNQV